MFQRELKEEIDLPVGMYHYGNCLSFNTARSPLFLELVKRLVKRAPSSYVPSSSETLRTIILDKAKRRVEEELETIKATWPQSGVSIVSYGWTNPTRHPLINFIVSSPNGPVFI